MEKILLRNMLYVPAYQKKLIEKSLTAKADAWIYDLEDSVPMQFKETARSNLQYYFENENMTDKKIFIRLNPLDSGLMEKDLEAVCYPCVTGFVPAKIESAEDIRIYDKLLEKTEEKRNIKKGTFQLAPLIETVTAVINIVEICKASDRIIAVLFGGEDFLDDLHGIHGNPPAAFHCPRAMIAMAARAAGILPVDTPYLAVHDEEGFIEEERHSYEMGFAGAQILSPRQIPLSRICFMPAQEEIKNARDIIEAWKSAARDGSGVAMLNGKMIGPPMRKKAEKILEIAEMAERYEQKLS